MRYKSICAKDELWRSFSKGMILYTWYGGKGIWFVVRITLDRPLNLLVLVVRLLTVVFKNTDQYKNSIH